MKHILTAVFLSYCVTLSISQSVPGKDAPASKPQLLQEFKTALKAKDEEAILSLFDWEGVSAEMKSFHRRMITELLNQQVTNVVLAPLPTNFPTSLEEGGVRYSLSIVPTGVLEPQFGHKDGSMPLPYGRKGGAFYIAASVEEVIATPEVGTNRTITVHVQTADGKALSNMRVACGSPDKIPYLQFGELFGGIKRLRSDDQGQLAISLDNTNLFLVAANADYFGWVPNQCLTNNAVMLMQPWGRIEGVRMNRNHPVAGEHLKLSPDRDFYGNGVLGSVTWPIRDIGGSDALTDASGHFTFERVPPLRLFIDRQEKQRGYWGYFWSVEVKPGETKRLEIDTRGRTVFGRVEVEARLGTNIDLSDLSGALLSDRKDREGARQSVGFPVSADGSFHADRVEPGDYKLSGDIWRDDKRVAMIDPLSVHVPDDASDAEDAPFNAGTATLKAAVNFMEGDTAPDFSCSTLDNKLLRLSDFQGKYVLLDFWATWCGPCVAETPNMKSTYEAFGQDKRFVMISLSLDSDQTAPKKFVHDHGIAWTQGFLEDWSNDKVTGRYGVYGIPAIFLVGPDGKVLATGLRGAKIREKVAQALAH